MIRLTNFPVVVLALSFFLLWLSGWFGASLRKKKPTLENAAGADPGVVLGATLTLLGLIIGFTFSMALSRYEQRKIYEEAEGNAIGTEYLRADLLPPTDARRVRALLADYLDQRILFYGAREERRRRQVNVETTRLQTKLWSTIMVPAGALATPMTALAVSGMNDVISAQGYTQAVWRDRIPVSAWVLMITIGLCCNLLIGYCIRRSGSQSAVFLVLTLVVSMSFFLIADIDSPSGGIILVQADNLVSLAQSFHSP